MDYAESMSAAHSRLEPGHTSIDRATPRERGDVYLLDWRIRLHDGRLVPKRSQGSSKEEVRRRAWATARELLATSGGASWKLTAPVADYITAVSRPAIEQARLRPRSRKRYLSVLGLLTGQCDQHRHAQSLSGHSISALNKPRVLEHCLKEIARLHGSESAHQARTVLGRYIIQEAIRDQLLTHNVLAGLRLDLSGPVLVKRATGGEALTRDEWNKVIDYLLKLDPADGIPVKAKGRWTFAERVARRARAIDLTLLQSATGLRISEALALGLVELRTVGSGRNARLEVHVSEEISKTHRARTIPILHDGVAHRLLSRQNAAASLSEYIVGAPTDPLKAWDNANAHHAVRVLYTDLAEQLDIPMLELHRSHVWRATLNSLMLDLPEVVRAAFFGHDPKVNRASYTDLTDTSSMVAAASRRLVVERRVGLAGRKIPIV
jgi:integrase